MKNGPRAATFELFPDLLPELRLEIWAHALPPENIIELAITHKNRSRYPRLALLQTGSASTWHIKTVPESSILRIVNHEARQVFLSHYSRTFIRDDPKFMRARPVWIDYRRDTIHFSKSNVDRLIRCITGEKVDGGNFPLHARFPFDFSKIRYIAAEWPPLGAFHGEEEGEQIIESPQDIVRDLVQLFELFPRLEEYAVVIDGRDLDFAWEEEFTADAEGRLPDLRNMWSGSLVDATVENCEVGGVILRGTSMLTPDAFVPLVEAIRKQKPGVRIPELKMKLLINDRRPEKVRSWDLFAGTCSLGNDARRGSS